MHTLLVVANPSKESLTHSLANYISSTLSNSGSHHTIDFLDLYAEEFNPVFSKQDVASYREKAKLPADVVAQQKRIEAAETLVLVFPLYWWGMPAMLKGWVDRVFTNGWAFDWTPEGGTRRKLKGLKVHVLCMGGSEPSTFSRRGYEASIKKNISEGLFEYVGASVESFHVMGGSESPEHHAEIRSTAEALSRSIARAL
ncbi:NAD(P)H-dependent oxidoreductase [Variovorax sp. ZT4R33]|uniref:NAD(P)H-dependent oxidoreductase n=1 Tax=Variovorax sp. ZT4R33 TaxID=3443743 RepID=UPI003F47E4B6